jgi:hypothetical protein
MAIDYPSLAGRRAIALSHLLIWGQALAKQRERVERVHPGEWECDYELHFFAVALRNVWRAEGSPVSGPAVMRVLVGVGWSRLGRTRSG